MNRTKTTRQYTKFLHVRIKADEAKLYAEAASLTNFGLADWVRNTLTAEARRLERRRERRAKNKPASTPMPEGVAA